VGLAVPTGEAGAPVVRFERTDADLFGVWITAPLVVDMDALRAAIDAPGADAQGIARAMVRFFGYELTPAEDALLSRYRAADTGLDFWAAVEAAGLVYVPPAEVPKKKRGRPRRLPAVVPQQTWPEFEAVVFGWVRDGKTGGADAEGKPLWQETPGEVALTHKNPGSDLMLKLGASAIDDPLKDYAPLVATSYDDLRDLLARHAGQRTAYLLNYTLARAAEKQGSVTMSIDELVSVSGPRPRSEAERTERSREAWYVMCLFAHIAVHGRRKSYENAGEMLRTAGPLVALTERADEGQLSLDGSDPPREFTYAAGPWFERLAAEDPSLLPFFGDVLALAQQPDRQPRHVWKNAVAWALGQRWRQNAKNAKERQQGMAADGTDKPSKLQTRDFTRRELLDYLNPEPHYADVIAGDKPGRAVRLWADAIALLRQQGIIGAAASDYVEHGPAPWRKPKDWPKGKLFKPQGWADAWLDEPLTIRPGPAGQAALQDVKASAAKARKRKPKRAAN
jgi:hypothetical protein